MIEKIAEKGLETVATMINSTTKDAQINSAEKCILAIIDALKSFTDEGLIDVDTYFEKLDGLGYVKDLSKYLGRREGLKIKFER
jgi:hypothetical protein